VQQWVSRYNNAPVNGTDWAKALALDGSANVYVTGHSTGSGTLYDYATVKYNSGGVEQWAAAARYNGPASGDDQAKALALDGSGNVYVTGYSTGSGTWYDYATVKYNSAGAQQWAVRYNGPAGSGDDQAKALALDGSGNVYVTGHSTGSGTGIDYATVRYGSDGVEQWVARYDGPTGGEDRGNALALDGSGNVYVTGYSTGAGTDLDYATAKYYTPVYSRLGGQYDTPGFLGDGGPAQNAKLNDPHGLYETADHTLYFADTGNGRIRRIQPRGPAGTITTVAGSATPGYCGDGGSATSACLNLPRDVFVDSDGNIFIADTGNNRIRKVAGGNISTVAGTGTAGYSGDSGPATSAKLNSPRGVAVDTAGNIYIADTVNNRIRKVDASTGYITTIAGNGTPAYCGDGGAATSACLNQPHDVYPWGSMYAGTTDLLIADTGNNVIRWLHGPSGIINTLAGTGASGFSGDDGPATSAQLQAPEAVASDASLAVFVADTQNDRIRRVSFGETTISTVAGGGDGTGCAANHTEPFYGCPATDGILNEPAGVATGSLSFSDTGSATLGGIDPITGEPTGSFSNAAACSGGMATIDWAFVVVVLGLILARRQVGGLLMRVRSVAGPAPGHGTTR